MKKHVFIVVNGQAIKPKSCEDCSYCECSECVNYKGVEEDEETEDQIY